MTVKELKEKLNEFPDNMDVFLDERLTEFTFGLVNSVSIKRATFGEDPDDPALTEDEIVVISED